MFEATLRILKPLLLAALLAGAQPGHADGYYPGVIDHYDGATGLYFRTVTTKRIPEGLISSFEPRRVITNLYIFNPSNGGTSRFFDTPPKGEITDILFETSLTDGQIDVISLGGGHRFKNNLRLAPDRIPRDKLLVGVKDEASGDTTLHVADKHGENQSVLTVVPAGADWHVDAANGKLRVVRQQDDGLTIESFDW